MALRHFALLAALTMNACASPPANTVADDVDPAVAVALADPIMTDPQLEGRTDTDSLRPAPQPIQALAPPGEPDPLHGDSLPNLVARSGRTIADHDAKSFAACNRMISYSIAWSNRLPAELPLPAEARVSEGAGSDNQSCGLRLVAFAAASPPNTMVDTYRRAALSGGYSVAEAHVGDTTVIKARRASDGAAFIASIGSATGGSTSVDLTTNRGR